MFSVMKNFKFWDHPLSLSIVSAIFLGLSFPPYDLSILQIPAFIFLFRITALSSSNRQLILYAYPSFVLWNLFVTYWLMMATVAGGIAAILANAAIMLIPLILIRKLFSSNLNPILASLIAASLWVSYEFLHHYWDLSWPWLTLGNGWSNLTGAVQFVSVTGVFGISFWVLFSAALFYRYLTESVKPILYSALIIFFAFPLFSVLATMSIHLSNEEPVEVVIVQPNSDSYEPFGGHSSLDELLDKLLTLSSGAVTPNTDVVIWPENAIDATVTFNSSYFTRIEDSLRVWNTQLITGGGLVEYFDEDNRPDVVRTSSSGSIYNVFNAAFHVNPLTENEVYRKGQLVPMVERFPFVAFFQKIDLFNWVDWGGIMGYGLGEHANNFQVNNHSTPALICYDSVFSGWVNEFVANDADFLTIITNDGWWGDSNGHTQHFAFARLRAMEHRMWVARSANNGISGIISPDGKVQLETEYWTEDAFSATIYTADRKTFYSRFGEWFGQLMLLISGFGVLFMVLNKNKK